MTITSNGKGLVGWCGRIAESRAFQLVIIAVIVANAVPLGLQTYDGFADRHEGLLTALDRAFLTVFVIELGIRILAFGSRPDRFFRDGWNVFDFVVVAAAFIPGLSANSTLLRVVRVLRVARLVSVVPDLRVIVRGLARSVAPLAGVLLLTVIVMYVYAILGSLAFGEELPERWGTAGRSMLTVFELLTLEGWNEIFHEARDVTDWAIPYFVSFILLGTFVVLNIVIAVVINSVEEARRVELEVEGTDPTVIAHSPEVAARLHALREAVDAIERHLGEPPATAVEETSGRG